MELEQKDNLLDYWDEHFGFREQELAAFRSIDRAHFISEEYHDQAYDDTPLPLVRGKTISQPTTVMIMTSALELRAGDKVFEVGTGSGYQAAIIGKIIGSGKVVSAEVIPELVHLARENIGKAGLTNIHIMEEDGSKGCPPEAPFDKIILTAACKEFPQELIDQLKVGGIIIGPVGSKDEQELVRGFKQEDGSLELEFLGAFIFTPMYGKYGFEV